LLLPCSATELPARNVRQGVAVAATRAQVLEGSALDAVPVGVVRAVAVPAGVVEL